MSVNVKLARRRKAQRSTGSTSPEWYEVRRVIPDAFRKWEQKTRTSKKEWKWQRGIAEHALSESQRNRSHFSMKRWESEKLSCWSMTAEGLRAMLPLTALFRERLASGEHVAGQWKKLDCDEELGLLHGMYGSMEAEFEVQRTIKEGGADRIFCCLLNKVIGPIKVHVDNKGIIDRLWRGERKCVDPKAGDADLWIKIWEELHLLAQKDISVEVEHVKAHRTKKE